ncbi:MAG: endolytic transglycosylase MltG [Anaerovoracaceae bacterium]
MGRNSRRKKNKKFNSWVLMALGVVLLLLLAGFVYLGGLSEPLDKDNKEYISISIPYGTSTQKIGTILEEEGVIKSGDKFKIYAKLHGFNGKLEAGDYLLSKSMDLDEIMNMMTKGFVKGMRFTVQEGLTVEQVASKLAKEGLVDKDEFLYEVEFGEFDYKYIPFLPEGKDRLEGFLMPNTYEVNKDATAHDIIDRMLLQFDRVYKDEYYSKATQMGYDLNQIVNIAAMIERETRVEDERKIVASVIYNRLNSNMLLQIDATVQYALGEQKERLLNRDLEIDSPYNTYKVKGLPKGPICSPGENSIIAALNPGKTDYYYYVLDASLNGSHRFSNDYHTFLKNKEDYLKAMENKK